MPVQFERIGAAVLLALSACSGEGPSVNPVLETHAGPNFLTDAGPGPVTGPGSDCSEAAKLVYVVSSENTLYSFTPSELKFTPIGALRCPSRAGAKPFSMAVDRRGTAWVNYDDGELFRVSTRDAACVPTGFVPRSGFATFGMGFATDAPGSSNETLYICGYDRNAEPQGRGLGRLDLKTLVPSLIGDFPAPFTRNCGELTGTGDARLFGFFEGFPAQLVGIDKGSATMQVARPLAGIGTSREYSYAFSHWGGDFWFYTAIGIAPSQVTRYKASGDGSLSVVIPNTGMNIVGAGVSTCAPTAPIK
jgi:hypothetical protein